MYRLIYASTASESFRLSDVHSIVAVSERNNRPRHLTGMLVFSSRYFLQWLEGPREAVNERYLRICQDPRHHSPVMLAYEPIIERQFTDWAMGYLGEGVLNRQVLMRYFADGQFQPYQLSGAAAAVLMPQLAELAYAIEQRRASPTPV